MTSINAEKVQGDGVYVVKNTKDEAKMRKDNKAFLTDITVNYYGEDRKQPIRMYYEYQCKHNHGNLTNTSSLNQSNLQTPTRRPWEI